MVGWVGRDAEVRRAKTKHVAKYSYFSLATYQKFVGREKPRVTWHNVCAWGNALAEFCGKYIKKGMLVQVIGKLDSRYYTTPEGEKRTVVDIRADTVIILSIKRKEKAQEEEPEEETPQSGQADESDYF